MESKTCTTCTFEKHKNISHKYYSACNISKRTQGLKRFYASKEKISNQQKLNYRK